MKDILALAGMSLLLTGIALIPTNQAEDPQERAVRVCHHAKAQHRLIYSEMRCVHAQLALPEDDNGYRF